MTILSRKEAEKVSQEIYEMVATRFDNSDLTASEAFETTICLSIAAVRRLAEEAANFEDKEITREYLKDTFGKIVSLSLDPKDILTMPACDDRQINRGIDSALKAVCPIFDEQKLGMKGETLLFRRLLAGLVFRQLSFVKENHREGVLNFIKQEIEKAFDDGSSLAIAAEENNNILPFPSKKRSSVLKKSKDHV